MVRGQLSIHEMPIHFPVEFRATTACLTPCAHGSPHRRWPGNQPTLIIGHLLSFPVSDWTCSIACSLDGVSLGEAQPPRSDRQSKLTKHQVR